MSSPAEQSVTVAGIALAVEAPNAQASPSLWNRVEPDFRVIHEAVLGRLPEGSPLPGLLASVEQKPDDDGRYSRLVAELREGVKADEVLAEELRQTADRLLRIAPPRPFRGPRYPASPAVVDSIADQLEALPQVRDRRAAGRSRPPEDCEVEVVVNLSASDRDIHPNQRVIGSQRLEGVEIWLLDRYAAGASGGDP